MVSKKKPINTKKQLDQGLLMLVKAPKSAQSKRKRKNSRTKVSIGKKK